MSIYLECSETDDKNENGKEENHHHAKNKGNNGDAKMARVEATNGSIVVINLCIHENTTIICS